MKRILLTISLLLKVIFILLIIAASWGNFFLFNHSYSQFINHIIEQYHIENKAEKLKMLITAVRYIQLKLFSLAILVTLFALAFKINYEKISSNISNNLQELKNDLYKTRKVLTSLPPIQKLILLVVLTFYTSTQFYYLVKFPFTIDEAFSYVFFISKGFFVSASYYPGPNNHILFSELATFFNTIFHNPVVSTRLTSLISSVITVILLFAYLQKKHGVVPAVLASVFFAYSSASLFFSVQGRGYALINLFVLVTYMELHQALNGKKGYWYLFTISSVLGFYTIPIFLYPFASFIAFALLAHIKERKVVVKLIIVSFLVILFVLLLYLPVLLLNGFNAITGNPWVTAKQNFFMQLPEYLISVCNYLWGTERYGIVITGSVLVLSIVFAILRKNKNILLLISCVYIIPILLIIIQRTLPFERVWTYFLIILAFQVAFIAGSFFYYIKTPKLLTTLYIFLAISFMVFRSIHFYAFYQGGYANYYRQLNTFMDTLYQKNPESVFVADDTYNVFIRYKWLVNNKVQPQIETLPENISPNYDCLIVPVNNPFPASLDSADYSFFYLNQHIKAYLYKKAPNEIIR